MKFVVLGRSPILITSSSPFCAIICSWIGWCCLQGLCRTSCEANNCGLLMLPNHSFCLLYLFYPFFTALFILIKLGYFSVSSCCRWFDNLYFMNVNVVLLLLLVAEYGDFCGLRPCYSILCMFFFKYIMFLKKNNHNSSFYLFTFSSMNDSSPSKVYRRLFRIVSF